MRICLVSTYAEAGGAAVAARRLHDGLLRAGADATFLTGVRTHGERAIHSIKPEPQSVATRAKQALGVRKTLLQERLSKPSATWSSNLIPRNIAPAVLRHEPDLVNLHWVGHDFFPIDDVARLQRPIVWTMHDAWAATGGCHYHGSCQRFDSECHDCPQLTSSMPFARRGGFDLARRVFRRKAAQWNRLDFSVVTPSEWLAQTFRQSRLFGRQRIEVIPYGVNLAMFRSMDRSHARACFGLPDNKLLVLFGGVAPTDDPRKGYNELVPALREAARVLGDRFAYVILGTHRKQDIGVPGFSVGRLRDETSLPLIYSACDLLVIPSLEDNSPNMAYEAAACGVPTVAFKTGGLPELVLEGKTGHTVPKGDSRALAEAITALLENSATRSRLAASARAHAERNFGLELQANRYLQLFHETAANHRRTAA